MMTFGCALFSFCFVHPLKFVSIIIFIQFMSLVLLLQGIRTRRLLLTRSPGAINSRINCYFTLLMDAWFYVSDFFLQLSSSHSKQKKKNIFGTVRRLCKSSSTLNMNSILVSFFFDLRPSMLPLMCVYFYYY